MEKYKVSIIIPIYNVEPYILECLQSVANQTMQEGLECILVDDCGADDSVKIAEDFVGSYDGDIDFSVLHHEQNLGLSEARNTGIRAAQGEYIYFLDSDDTITLDCMEIMWSYVEKYGKVDLVQGSFFEDVNEKGAISPIDFPVYSIDRHQIKMFLLQYLGDIVRAQSRLVKTSFLKENNLYFRKGIIHEDNLWTFFLAKYVGMMAFCNVCTYYHRYNPNSITGNVNVQKEVFSYRHIIEEMCESIDEFLSGVQKELIISNLITVLENKYCQNDSEKNELLAKVFAICSFSEKMLLKLYLLLAHRNSKNKVLHLLLRKFKCKD